MKKLFAKFQITFSRKIFFLENRFKLNSNWFEKFKKIQK